MVHYSIIVLIKFIFCDNFDFELLDTLGCFAATFKANIPKAKQLKSLGSAAGCIAEHFAAVYFIE